MTLLNYALQANGGVASANANEGGTAAPAYANDGSRVSNSGGTNYWRDGTNLPTWWEVAFSGTKFIERVDMYTLRDVFTDTSAVGSAETISLYGITDYNIQYWNGSAYVTLVTVSANNKVWRTHTFTAVPTTKIRINVTGRLGGATRLVELEAYAQFGVAAQYPTPPEFGGVSGGVQWSYYNAVEPDYMVDEYTNQNGSVDRLQWGDPTTPVRVFQFNYDGLLSEAEAAVLDAHYDSAQGNFVGFNFMEPRTGVLYTNVHYKTYKRSHVDGAMGRTQQIRQVELVWSPV
jgi:hypothetical protein